MSCTYGNWNLLAYLLRATICAGTQKAIHQKRSRKDREQKISHVVHPVMTCPLHDQFTLKTDS